MATVKTIDEFAKWYIVLYNPENQNIRIDKVVKINNDIIDASLSSAYCFRPASVKEYLK